MAPQTPEPDPALAQITQRVYETFGGPELPDAKPQHVAVLLALLKCGIHGQDMRPSTRTLELMTLLSRRAVQRALDDLESWNVLLVMERLDKKPTVYNAGPVLTTTPGVLRDALQVKSESIEQRELSHQLSDEEKQARRHARAIVAAQGVQEDLKARDTFGNQRIDLPAGITGMALGYLKGEDQWNPDLLRTRQTELQTNELPAPMLRKASAAVEDMKDEDEAA